MKRRYRLVPPPLGPGGVGELLEAVSDRELAGEPLPPVIELIPVGLDRARATETRPAAPAPPVNTPTSTE